MARPWKEYGRYGSVGIELVLSLLVGLWLGSRGDEKFGTRPYLTILGFVVGAYAGFRSLVAAARHMQRDIERAERAERGEDPWEDEAPPGRRNDPLKPPKSPLDPGTPPDDDESNKRGDPRS